MHEATKSPRMGFLILGVIVGWALTLFAAARSLGLG